MVWPRPPRFPLFWIPCAAMGIDLHLYRQSPSEKTRLDNLMAIIPKGRQSVLDVGARDGYVYTLLAAHFTKVIAVDVKELASRPPGVLCARADVTSLSFLDNSFDVVVCAEVLEHIPEPMLGKACAEIIRVARHEVVIGVPYKQDIRFGRTICLSCGRGNPPWGHVNSFDENRLKKVFGPLRFVAKAVVGPPSSKTNLLSSGLMDLAGNPWGTYNQEEVCIWCGAALIPPQQMVGLQRVFAKLGQLLTKFQNCVIAPTPMWIHAVFAKEALSQ